MILSTESCMLHKAVGDRRSIEIIAQAGFDAVDYTFTPYMEDDDPQWQGSSLPATARTLKQIASDNGVYFNQAHSPFRFQFEDEYHPDLERIVALQARCLEACALMGIPHTIVHPLHHLPYKPNHDHVWAMNLEYFHMLEPYAKEFGVKVCLENMFGRDARRGGTVPDMLGNPEEYAHFFDELNNPDCFTCCLDTGHCGLTDEDAADFTYKLGKRIHALHLNDNRYRNDDHLIPYQGSIDWEKVIKALADVGYDGDFTFEALHLYKGFDESFLPTVARYLHDVGRYMIGKFDQYRATACS